MTPDPRPLLLVNTHSRQGRGSLDRAAALFAQYGLPARPQAPESPQASDALLRAEVEAGARLVLVGGGDGTLSRAAGVLRGSGTALGVLPLGSGNTFARSVGVPLELEGAAQVAARGEDRPVDLGTLSADGGPETVFLNSVGAGFSAELADALTPEMKRHLGLLAWPAAAAGVFGRHHALRLRLSVPGLGVPGTGEGGERHTGLRTHQLLVANGRYVAGPLRAGPAASVADGQLDVLALGGGRLSSLVRAALGWLSWSGAGSGGLRAGSGALHFVTAGLEVRSLRGAMTLSVDGEVSRHTTLRLGVQPRGLLVRVPPGFDPHSA